MSRLPDAINARPKSHFTVVPNDMLRNPDMSAKAKGLLCILLSNTDGWTSYMSGLQSVCAEGRDSIYSGLRELEDCGYLRRIVYVEKTNKQVAGSFWAYTSEPNEFDIADHLDRLEGLGYEVRRSNSGPTPDKPEPENPQLRRLKIEENEGKKDLYVREPSSRSYPEIKPDPPPINKTKHPFLDAFPTEWQTNERFLEAWADYVQTRKDKGNPIHILTMAPKTIIGRHLLGRPMEEVIAILDLSSSNGWIGLFPDQIETDRPKPRPNTPKSCSDTSQYSNIKGRTINV